MPVIVTTVPPASSPLVGLMRVTVGAAAAGVNAAKGVKWLVVPVTVCAAVFSVVGTACHVLPSKNAISVGGVSLYLSVIWTGVPKLGSGAPPVPKSLKS